MNKINKNKIEIIIETLFIGITAVFVLNQEIFNNPNFALNKNAVNDISYEKVILNNENNENVEPPILPATNNLEETYDIVIDFDSLYEVALYQDDTVEDDGGQAFIDAGGICITFGDYYHHNTPEFTSLIKSLNPNDKIKLNGIIYNVDYQEYGQAVWVASYRGYIYGVDTGTTVQSDDITQIVICEDDDSGYNRFLTAISPVE